MCLYGTIRYLYLGLLNYYGKFLPNPLTEFEPLYKLLRAEQTWKWSERETAAFQKIKKSVNLFKTTNSF